MSTAFGTSARPDVRTGLPGPKSAEYLARQDSRESNARTYPRRLPVALERGEGAYVEDVDGNVFLDFLAGAGVLALGHNHPEVVAAVEQQLGKLVHGLDLPTPVKDEFTEAHLALLPEPMRARTKVHFCGPTGANAVEAALKLCKSHTGRPDVITFQGGFHGSTHGAMAVTGYVAPKAAVPGGMPDAHFFPYSYCYRCPLGLDASGCDTNCATYLENSLRDTHGGIPKPAAVLLELVQGEGGVIPATQEFATRVAHLAKELGAPLIVDEIQTGYGRTGSWFAFERYGLEPDVVVASKAAGGIGLPVSVMFYDRALDTWGAGAHIGTFRGHQLAFAASVAALRVMRRDDVLGNVAARGAQLRAGLDRLAETDAALGDVRGAGLMLGVEIVDPATGAPDPARAAGIQRSALNRGLIVELGGRADAVVRLLPPLTIDAPTVDLALEILAGAVAAG
ncbi:diaminobutyrate--2-oxoglutarate transaminase family protein [Amycolatopsis sp. PS_44_ISF1]|uniref:diaminobutyrate--2-oxoglutarate transaminase family protein n=1 Tax=Amycolatopsis sp. PS_44_ISF1 TaxID=2974917 RepID=UPI0028DDB074|nr:diaminobutyrate--2-oxoglutarate transaminase family protein [Amycolatopsis sp. PS_44_ISF1]MDT8912360.1 diaminobutyrate--2-oxoglutarate transaminase family protein [Amycolatopsis sp. PS_44_ISF1]